MVSKPWQTRVSHATSIEYQTVTGGKASTKPSSEERFRGSLRAWEEFLRATLTRKPASCISAFIVHLSCLLCLSGIHGLHSWQFRPLCTGADAMSESAETDSGFGAHHNVCQILKSRETFRPSIKSRTSRVYASPCAQSQARSRDPRHVYLPQS